MVKIEDGDRLGGGISKTPNSAFQAPPEEEVTEETADSPFN